MKNTMLYESRALRGSHTTLTIYPGAKRYRVLLPLLAGLLTTSPGMAIAAHLPAEILPTRNSLTLTQAEVDQPTNQTPSWRNATLLQSIPEAGSIPGSPDLTVISANGRQVASVISTSPEHVGETVRVWDVTTGEPLYTINAHHQFVSAIAFSPDGRLLATADYSIDRRMLTIHLWDTATGQRIHSLFRALSPKYYQGAYYHRVVLAFSHDSQTLYSAAVTPVIQVWDVNQGSLTENLVGYREVIRAIAVSPNGQTLAMTHVDGTLSLFDLQQNRMIQGMVGGRDGFSVGFSPDGQQVMGMFDFRLDAERTWRQIVFWNVDSSSPVRWLADYSDQSWFAFSPDGQTFANAIYGQGIQLRSLETGEELTSLPTTSHNFAFSPDGQLFVAVTDNRIEIWQPAPPSSSGR